MNRAVPWAWEGVCLLGWGEYKLSWDSWRDLMGNSFV